jgi:DNA-binding transcriptional MerR regulator
MTGFKIDQHKGETPFNVLEEEYFSEEYTLKDLGVSARVLQNWSDRGILPDKKREEDQNHKFNFVELIWLKLILELRLLGYPIENIKKVKKALLGKQSFLKIFKIGKDENIAERLYPILASRVNDKKAFYEYFSSSKAYQRAEEFKISTLQMLITQFVDDREAIKIICFNDGESFPFIPGIHDRNPDLLRILEKEPHISIPLFKLMLNFLTDEKNYDFISKGIILNETEIQILGLVRAGKFKTVTIHFSGQKPKTIDVTELIKIPKEARLSEILLNREYERLEIKTQSGNITYAPLTTTYKLK